MANFSPVVIARDDQRLVRQVDRTAAIGEAHLIWKVPAECWGSKAKVAAWRGTTAEIL